MLIAALALVFGCAGVARADWLVISVDKTTQTMTVSLDGLKQHVWPVSTGDMGYNTPVGMFHPLRMKREHFSREWDNAPMPFSIFFTAEGHAIHGSAYTKRLGKPASHGCVRLSRANAATLFSMVRAMGLANTLVVIGGEEQWDFDAWLYE